MESRKDKETGAGGLCMLEGGGLLKAVAKRLSMSQIGREDGLLAKIIGRNVQHEHHQ